MFVLPLGLGTKLRRWPVVTAAVAAVWLLALFTDHSQERIGSELPDRVSLAAVQQATRQLFVEYCSKAKGQVQMCRRYAYRVWSDKSAGMPANPRPSFRLQAVRAAAAISTFGGGSAPTGYGGSLRSDFGDCDGARRCLIYKDLVAGFLHEEAALSKDRSRLFFSPHRATQLCALPAGAKRLSRGSAPALRSQ